MADGIVSGLRALNGRNLVQTSAPISPGSLGGGLFDARGNLVGITTFLLRDAQNLNFAIFADALLSCHSDFFLNLQELLVLLRRSMSRNDKAGAFGASVTRSAPKWRVPLELLSTPFVGELLRALGNKDVWTAQFKACLKCDHSRAARGDNLPG